MTDLPIVYGPPPDNMITLNADDTEMVDLVRPGDDKPKPTKKKQPGKK